MRLRAISLAVPLFALACALLAPVASPAIAAELPSPGIQAVQQPVTHVPFWRTAMMEREPLFFLQTTDGAAATASLLFVPEGPVVVTSSDGSTTYQDGVDYHLETGSRVLSLLPGSRIAFKTVDQMHPLPGSPQSYASWRGGKRSLFWSEGHVFHDLQVAVTYTHTDSWTGFTPAYAGAQLPGTIAKLTAHQPLKLVVLGDSISQGYNASKFVGVAPFQAPYPELVATELGAYYGAPVSLTNLAVAGKDASWGATMVKAVAAEKPDLVCVAFGMNDAGGTSATVYAKNMRKIIDGVSAACPGTEFILIATMTGNPEWTGAAPKVYPQYRDQLAKLAGPGTVLADMTALWTDLLQTKSFADLTGNGLNHPNDFGHRMYADVLLGLLTPLTPAK